MGSRRIIGSLGIACAISACTWSSEAQQGRPAATVDRMYVIDCGENHAKDLSLWTTAEADRGRPFVFSNNCYLIRHGASWMLWDSGHPDRVAAMPGGQTNPRGTLTAFVKKPLVESLKEIGVAPESIEFFAMSHSHGDHSGNAGLFARSAIYMQAAEYDAIHGPEPQKMGIPPANFEKLADANIVKLNGDHDVFGDGSVVIKSTPGHTPGHQSLLVRLPRTGPVLLSGDFVHLKGNWEAKRVPPMNYSIEQSARSMNEMEAFLKMTGAKLWINHDPEQSRAIPRAPAFVE
jgi:N-acyl homoserine lactone hydrolase